jgi:hypothetical protein
MGDVLHSFENISSKEVPNLLLNINAKQNKLYSF